MKKVKIVLFCFIIGALHSAMVFANGAMQGEDDGVVTIKLASMVPEATPWGEALNKMAKDWAQISNGSVQLIVYHNGVAGDESNILRKLKSNQIQAAVLTSFGLNAISPEIMTLSCPFLIRTDDELDLVLKELGPELEQSITEKGYQPVAWSKAGWVRFFSRTPVYVPADLKKQKLATAQDEPILTNTFKSMGYQMVPMGINDTIMSLNSGAIDAVFQSPIAAAPMQIFGIAKNMASLRVAPFLGAIVVNSAGWNAIPEQYRAPIIENSRNTARVLDTKILQLEDDAIKTMQSYGLQVNQVSPAQMEEWYKDMDRVIPSLLASKTFDATLYNKISAILKTKR